MGFYLRKSVKAGPFRLNLSKSGIGVSTGVPGLRIGTGPRGTYVHMGRHGLYYRATLGGGPKPRPSGPHGPHGPHFVPSSDVVDELGDVTVLELGESSANVMVDDLNRAASRFPLSPLAWAKGRRHVAVFYDVTDEGAQAFGSLTDAFKGLSGSHGAWLLDAQRYLPTTHQRKVNALASQLIARSPVQTTVVPPKYLATNILVPGLITKAFSVHFLPDTLLVRRGKRFAGWPYDTLTVTTRTTRFIESGRVPGDSQRVGQTWQYANVGGGPDRRFKNNRQLPIMAYAELLVSSASQLRLIWQFSNVTAADGFGAAVRELARTASALGRRRPSEPSVPPDEPATSRTGRGTTHAGRHRGPVAGWYADPGGGSGLRWWDGAAWTTHTAPRP